MLSPPAAMSTVSFDADAGARVAALNLIIKLGGSSSCDGETRMGIVARNLCLKKTVVITLWLLKNAPWEFDPG